MRKHANTAALPPRTHSNSRPSPPPRTTLRSCAALALASRLRGRVPPSLWWQRVRVAQEG
eukprot:6626975-Prymnesium_polylepis.1